MINETPLKNMSLQECVAVDLERVKREICDNYCKYPLIWDEEKEGRELYTSDICANCPLCRL